MATKTNAPLQDDASTAALYVTSKAPAKSTQSILDEKGRLSASSAAISLKYAKASSLPSYPSQGGVELSSAGAAASLANNIQRASEHWKPGALPTAERAASLAKDHQADPSWRPDFSTAGSKAALIAAQGGGNVQIWIPSGSNHRRLAAGQAVNMKSTGQMVEKNVPSDAHRKALLAASGAMLGSRRRAESAPSESSGLDIPWALKAATTSHRATISQAPTEFSDPAVEASRILHIAKSNVNRSMYSANPPVSIEVEEKNRQDTLRASAVAMARKMYAIQQNAIDGARDDLGSNRVESRSAATTSHRRRLSTSSIGTVKSTLSYTQYTNLQEAATKLAQERLSKLENEHKAYREYYGQSSQSRSRLSRHLRRRASSDSQLDKVDEEQSRKIRSQMSLFKSRVEEIDERKRQKDREALMVAAQKRVTASMSAMDEKVFNETGKASPAMMKKWEDKARQRAEADSAIRMENFGKVDVGGGKFLDQSTVEAVARSRLQPTFDDIAEKAEAQRARDEEIRLDQEEKRRKAELDKVREADLKAALKSAKEKEKQEEHEKNAEEKRQHDQEKKEEKTRKEEEKRLVNEQKKKSRDVKSRSFGLLGLGGISKDEGDTGKKADEGQVLEPIPLAEPKPSSEGVDDGVSSKRTDSTPSHHLSKRNEEAPFTSPEASEPVNPTTTKDDAIQSPHETRPPPSPSKKSWFSRHFKRGSKSKLASEAGFFGVAGIGSRPATSASSSSSGDDSHAESSIRDVAMAGRITGRHEKGKEREKAVSDRNKDGMFTSSDTNPNATTFDDAHANKNRGSPSIDTLSSSTSMSDDEGGGEEKATTDAADQSARAEEHLRHRSLRLTDAIKSRLRSATTKGHYSKQDQDTKATTIASKHTPTKGNETFEEARSGSVVDRDGLSNRVYPDTTATSTGAGALKSSGAGIDTSVQKSKSKFSERL